MKPLNLIPILACLFVLDRAAAEVFKSNSAGALNQPASWVSGGPPGAGDVAVWDNAAGTVTNTILGASMTWNGIRVVTWSVGPTIRPTSGLALTLDAAGVNMSAAACDFTVNAELQLGANQSWNIAAGRTLTAGALSASHGMTLTKTGDGALSLNGATTYSGGLQINAGTVQVINASGTQTLAGPLSGSGPLNKTGAGALALAADNSAFTGPIGMAAGQLNLNHPLALGGATLTIAGGALDNTSGAPVTLAAGSLQNWDGNFTFVGTSSLNLGGSTVTVNGHRALTVSGGVLVAGGVVTGADSLAKAGAGTLEVPAGGNLDMGGKLAVSGGTLRVAGGTVACGTMTFSPLEIGGGGTVALDGGTLKVGSVTRTSATAAFRFNGGTLRPVTDSATFMTGLDAAHVGAGGAKVDLDGWWVTIAQPLLHDPALGGTPDGGLTLDDSFINGKLTLTGASTCTGPTLIRAGTLALGAGGSLAASPVIEVQANGTLDAGNGATIAPGQTLQGTGTVTGNLTVGAGATLAPGGAVIATLTALDTLRLAGNAAFQINKTGGVLTSDQVAGLLQVTYGGTLTVTATGSALGNGDKFKLFGATTYGGAFAVYQLPGLPVGLFWDTASLTVDGTIAVVNAVPSPLITPASGLCFDGQSVGIVGMAGSMIHYTVDGSDPKVSPTTITALSPVIGVAAPAGGVGFTVRAYASLAGISDSATTQVDFTYTDTGIWTTPGSGTWSDALNWNGGLVAQGANVTADFSTVGLTASATVTLDSSRVIGALKFGDTFNAADWFIQPVGGATLTLSAPADQPFIEVVNRTTTIAAPLAGTQGFEKAGAGTLVLAGANSSAGVITVSGGVLRVGDGGSSGTLGDAAVINNATLEFHRNDTYTVANTISGSGKIHVKPGGTVTFTGALTTPSLRAHEAGSRTVILGGTQPNAINALETNQDGHCNWVFAKPPGVNAFSGPLLEVGNGYNSTSRLRLDNDEQIADTTTVRLIGTQPYYSGHNYLDLNGHNETIAGVVSTNVWTHVQNGAATPSVLTLAGGGSYGFVGSVNDGSTGTLSIVWNGTGSQTFSGTTIDYTGSTTVNAGRLILSGNDDTWTSAMTIAAGAVVEINRDGADTYEHRNAFTLSGAGTLEKTGAGTMDMNWDRGGTVAMASGGHIHVKEGTLRLGYGSISNWSANKSDLTVEAGAFFDLWDNNNAGVFIDALDGGGGITRSNYAQTSTLTVGIDNGSGNFTGSISSASGTTHFVKAGLGTQRLSGPNTYPGATTVTAGTLLVNNTSGSGTGSGNVTVISTATLGGSGTAAGSVTVNVGATLAPGAAANTIGTLTTGALTLAGTCQCQVGGSTADRIAVNGNLVLTGSTLAVSAIGATEAGVRVIASYAGTRTGSFGGTLPAGYSVDYDDTAKQVKLTVAAGSDPYGDWASSQGLTGTNNGKQQDPDGDGVTNLFEFYLAGDPLANDSTILLRIVDLDAATVTFGFSRLDAAEASFPVQIFQYGSTLAPGPWTTVTIGAGGSTAPGGVVVTVAEAGGDPDWIEVAVPRSLAQAGKIFGRLELAEDAP